MASAAAQPRETLLALEPRAESAGLARRALAQEGLHEDLRHTVALLVTELIANAVRHAGLADDQRVVLFARLCDDHVRVELADPGPGFDPDAVAQPGYGLRLLDKLASAWGVDRQKGCRVWFEVDRRRRRFERS